MRNPPERRPMMTSTIARISRKLVILCMLTGCLFFLNSSEVVNAAADCATCDATHGTCLTTCLAQRAFCSLNQSEAACAQAYLICVSNCNAPYVVCIQGCVGPGGGGGGGNGCGRGRTPCEMNCASLIQGCVQGGGVTCAEDYQACMQGCCP